MTFLQSRITNQPESSIPARKIQVEYVLIGGVAVILHGMRRLTQDVDVFVSLAPENIAKLRDALRSLYEDEGIKIKLATPEMLFELKRDTLRDKDKIDAAFLAELIKERQAEKKRQA